MLRKGTIVAVLLVVLGAGGAAGQPSGPTVFKGRLSPVPVPAASPTVTGVGSVTATLTGTRLALNGTFEGLNTPATAARLHKSLKPGIRGPVVFELTVTSATSGTIAGAFDLTPAQVKELAQNRYYVQVHSEKAPDGNLWGWLFAQEQKR